jgi:predicted HNH restriction endonuclease
MNNLKHIKRFNEAQENLNISDVIESKKSGGKEITAEKWMEDFMRHTGLTKEDALKKLKEFAEELKKTKQK